MVINLGFDYIRIIKCKGASSILNICNGDTFMRKEKVIKSPSS